MFSYRPDDSGDWLAAAAPACLAIVRRDGAPGAAARLWASLSGGGPGVLDDLASAGLFTAPPFALLTWQGEGAQGLTVRAILRGDVSVRLNTAEGPVDLTGRESSTWLEHSHSGVTGFVVDCGGSPLTGARGAEPTQTELPLVSGLVRARWVASGEAGAGAEPSVVRPGDVEPVVIAPAVIARASIEPDVSEPAVHHPAVSHPAGQRPVVEETLAETTLAGVTVVQDIEAGYDHLFGATMMRGVEQAAVRPEEPDAVETDSVETDSVETDSVETERGLEPGQESGDTHDGLTIMSSDLHKLHRSARPTNEPEERDGHVPPQPGPALCLILPDGSREALGRPLIVGRAPSVSQVSGGVLPRLISVAGTDQDISRNHLRFTVEGDTVVVTDLNSRNGTVIVLPGKAPQKLRGGESTSIIVGTVIDLGSGVALTVGED
jgi:hypothetical protein